MHIQVGSEAAQHQVEEFLKNPIDIFTHNSFETLLDTFSAKKEMEAKKKGSKDKKSEKKKTPGKKDDDEEDAYGFL
jgi:hypothetical protein